MSEKKPIDSTPGLSLAAAGNTELPAFQMIKEMGYELSNKRTNG